MAMIKVGTKAKVVIGIINTHFSIYPSNEAFLFSLSDRFIRNNSIYFELFWVLRFVCIIMRACWRMSTAHGRMHTEHLCTKTFCVVITELRPQTGCKNGQKNQWITHTGSQIAYSCMLHSLWDGRIALNLNLNLNLPTILLTNSNHRDTAKQHALRSADTRCWCNILVVLNATNISSTAQRFVTQNTMEGKLACALQIWPHVGHPGTFDILHLA